MESKLIDRPMEGISAWTNARGFRVIRIHYTADPEKDAEWVKREKAGYPNLSDWAREYEIDFEATSGNPVYSEYDASLHERELSINPYKPFYRGWDFGYGHPAVVVTQFDDSDRWLIIKEFLGTNILLDKFADKVLTTCGQLWPGTEVYDFCDPSGKIRSDKNEKSSIQILHGFGIRPKSLYTSVSSGIELVGKKLRTLNGKFPSLLLDPARAPLLGEGFRGGYKREEPVEGKSYSPTPVPSMYSHLMDALRYIAICLFQGLGRGKGTPRDGKKLVRSYA